MRGGSERLRPGVVSNKVRCVTTRKAGEAVQRRQGTMVVLTNMSGSIGYFYIYRCEYL